MDRHFINIVLVGLAFMILFTAFQATGMIAPSVLEGVKNDTINGTSFQGSGYISLAIVYTLFTIANIFAPVVVSTCGSSISMFIGGITCFLYVLSFISPMVWSYYLVSILFGIGAAILWTAQGVYLSRNSNEMTISRNTGVFWAMYQSSLIPGNLYVYLSIDTEMITRSVRYPLFTVFSIVSAVGIACFGLVIWRTFSERRRANSELLKNEEKVSCVDTVETLKIALRLLKTRNMLLLLIPFGYTGFALTFFQTVYPTCIGHLIKYGGGGLFGFITKPKTSLGRSRIVFVGFIVQLVFYYLVFINFPSDAPANETNNEAYFNFKLLISQILTFVGSFLIGLGDCSFHTQLFNILASQYKNTSASAFALFQLVQGGTSAVAYVYASSLAVEYQLLILVITLLLSTLALFVVLFSNANNDFDEASPLTIG
ncbi:unnamed protein product [Adineta ricciae]|uniref:UNC93-like protein MFSD11 n=1 Tax=Adineta ricciae TaxID=249248 RepID=A0A816B4P3_ADIRI|nr:unnamed protein product [Adineta ricciae]